MRFQFQNQPRTQTIVLNWDSGWQEAPTPSEMKTQIYSLALSCAGMLLVGVVLHGEIVPRNSLASVLILALTLPVHELLHAFSTPGWGLSAKTVFGLRQNHGLWTPYVSFDGKQPLWRFLVTGLVPTVLLNLLPLTAVVIFPMPEPTRTGLGFLAFFNIALSGGDLFLVFWFSKSLPIRVSVRQGGWKLFWKIENSQS